MWYEKEIKHDGGSMIYFWQFHDFWSMEPEALADVTRKYPKATWTNTFMLRSIKHCEKDVSQWKHKARFVVAGHRIFLLKDIGKRMYEYAKETLNKKLQAGARR